MDRQRVKEDILVEKTISKLVDILNNMKEELNGTWEVSSCYGEELKSLRTKLIFIKVLPSTTNLRMDSNMKVKTLVDSQDLLISLEMLAAPRI